VGDKMTNDLISQAEALIEKHTTSGYIHRDATLLLPGLVEEIKQCKSLNNGLMANCNQLRDRCWKAEGELSKWQQIAIDERAQIIQYHRGILHPLDRPSNFWESMPKDEYAECRDLAAKEIGLQVEQESEYVERLERLALSMCIEAGWSQEDFEAALEKIRKG
jgi:hypothetical protein